MSVRLRRLYAEYERLKALFASHERIRIVDAIGDPPDRYIIEYHVKGLTETKEGAIEERYLHRVQITLGPNYPKDMPTCVILGTPVFHPNIDHLAICTEDVSAAGRTLDHTIVFIGELITFQAYNLQSPRNGDAAHWTEQNRARLPLETIDLFPRPLLEGSAVPVLRASDVAAGIRKCANCGRSGQAAGLRECAGHHVACSDCALPCGNCSKPLCALCKVHSCIECRRPLCEDCAAVCSLCHREICPEHTAQCPMCSALRCRWCAAVCRGCGWRVCGEHLDDGGLCPSCRNPGASANVGTEARDASEAGPSGTAQYPAMSRESSSQVAVMEPPMEPRPVPTVVITAEEAMVVPESALLRPSNQIEIAPSAVPETSGKAVASLVFGIAGVPLLGVLVGWFALLFGALAFRDIRRNPQLRGRKMAAYGIGLGGVGIVVWTVLLIAFGSYFFGPRIEPVRELPRPQNPRLQRVYVAPAGQSRGTCSYS